MRITELEAHWFSYRPPAYWVLPGEYRLHGRLVAWVSPAPKGAHKDSDGFGLVSVRCPPVKLTVRSVCLPPLDPLVRVWPAPAFGSLVPPPEDHDTLKLCRRLCEPCNFPEGAKDKALDDILAFFADKYHFTFRIDEAAFERAGKKRFSATKPSTPPLIGVAMVAILYLLLDPLDADFDVRGKVIWIVPRTKPQSLAARLQRLPFSRQAKFRERISFKDSIPAGTPLTAALKTLGEQFHVHFLIDEPAFERAGTKGIAQKAVQLAAQKDVRLDQLLYELLHPVGAAIAIREDAVIFVPLP